jgi:tripartite-type tricarboxylate transporter receptor subunit TctC
VRRLRAPSTRKLGFQELVLDQWIGVFVPTGTPAEISQILNAEINKALAVPSVRESLEHQALEPVGGTVKFAERLFREDYAKYARLIKELNIKA